MYQALVNKGVSVRESCDLRGWIRQYPTSDKIYYVN